MCHVKSLNAIEFALRTRHRYFGHIPPTLEDLLPLDDELIPVDLGQY